MITSQLKNKYEVWRILLLPKELIGFINGLIASYLATILMDTWLSNSTKIWLTIGGILVIVMSIALIKYRDNYDDNKKVKSKLEAWISINNNESENKIIGLLPKHGILFIYFATIIVFTVNGFLLFPENNRIKHEQIDISKKTFQTNLLVHSIDTIMRNQLNSVDSFKTDMQLIEKKIDSLIKVTINDLNEEKIESIIRATIKKINNNFNEESKTNKPQGGNK